jgi:chromosome partitioning protein
MGVTTDMEGRTDMERRRTHWAAIGNQKGGVGKTTLTINLSAALAYLGQRVLVIDVDPQGHLTQGIGHGKMWEGAGYNLFRALTEKEPDDIHRLITAHEAERFDFIPSHGELALTERALAMARNREYRLRNLLQPIEGEYDWILIDCPPDLYGLTDNALNAARNIIVPIQAEGTSLWALNLLLDQIASMEKELRIAIQILAIVPNLVLDSAMAKKILADLRRDVPNVTPFELRKRVMLQQAWSAGQSIFTYKPTTSADEKGRQEIVEGYTQLAQFVLERVGAGVSVG